MSRRVVTVCVAASAALALGGCVSLLPQGKPVQLYELSPEVEAAPTAGPGRPALRRRTRWWGTLRLRKLLIG